MGEDKFQEGIWVIINAQAERRAGKREWHAMPGGQYEYADSGFRIELITEDRRIRGMLIPASSYVLISPEGTPQGIALEPCGLFEQGEHLASHRYQLQDANANLPIKPKDY